MFSIASPNTRSIVTCGYKDGIFAEFISSIVDTLHTMTQPPFVNRYSSSTACSSFDDQSPTQHQLSSLALSVRPHSTARESSDSDPSHSSNIMPSENDNSQSNPIQTTGNNTTDSKLQPMPSKKVPVSFLGLPRELRDMIYRHSIAAGNTEILRTNKLVSEEATQLLSKNAIFRVNLGFPDREPPTNLASGPITSAQHVEFRLDTSSAALPFDIDLIASFAGTHTTRESCLVNLNYGKEGSATYQIEHDALFVMLEVLTGFKSLTIKIVIERYEASEFKGLLTEEQFRETFPYESRLLSHHRESYQKVRGFLERSLGPAKFDDSVEGHCLEFHPLEALSENSNPGVEGCN